MIKVKKILTKCLAGILGFALLPSFYFVLGTLSTSASSDVIGCNLSYHQDKFIFAEIFLQNVNVGEKVELSEVVELEVYAHVQDTCDEEISSEDILINFVPKSNITFHEIPIKYMSDVSKVVYYHYDRETNEHLLLPSDPDVYTEGSLMLLVENGSSSYESIKGAGVDLRYKISLSPLLLATSVKTGTIGLVIHTGAELPSKFDRYKHDVVYYATDGEYVAFSDVSYEDAIFILTGELPDDPWAEDPPAEEPRGFWATFIDLFDGCD